MSFKIMHKSDTNETFIKKINNPFKTKVSISKNTHFSSSPPCKRYRKEKENTVKDSTITIKES